MSYSPPTGNAVNFQLEGGYVPPLGGAITFQFESQHKAHGFCSTSFGIPSIQFVAQGFSVTQFAQPLAAFSQFELHVNPFQEISFGTPIVALPCLATGFSTTQFGTPLLSIGDVFGWKSTLFGTPSFSGVYAGSASGWSDIVFGDARLRTKAVKSKGFGVTQFGLPKATIGWLVTQFGKPRYVTQHDVASAGAVLTFGTPSSHRVYSAMTMGQMTIFGTVYSPVVQRQQVIGAQCTQFGSVKASRSQRVAGFSAGQFGYPRSALSAHAMPLTPTQFGTPLSARRQSASGGCQTRFGTPIKLFIDTYADRYLPSLSVRSRTNRLDVWTEL